MLSRGSEGACRAFCSAGLFSFHRVRTHDPKCVHFRHIITFIAIPSTSTTRVSRHKLTDRVGIASTCESGSLATVSGGETVQG